MNLTPGWGHRSDTAGSWSHWAVPHLGLLQDRISRRFPVYRWLSPYRGARVRPVPGMVNRHPCLHSFLWPLGGPPFIHRARLRLPVGGPPVLIRYHMLGFSDMGVPSITPRAARLHRVRASWSRHPRQGDSHTGRLIQSRLAWVIPLQGCRLRASVGGRIIVHPCPKGLVGPAGRVPISHLAQQWTTVPTSAKSVREGNPLNGGLVLKRRLSAAPYLYCRVRKRSHSY